MDRRFIYLDEGDMMEAISDYVNKKSLRRLIPDWETLDLPFKALKFECFISDDLSDTIPPYPPTRPRPANHPPDGSTF